jgi:uncharacterized protein (TIGR01732 family)
MYGYGYGAGAGCFTGAPVAPVAGYGRGFALIVVLFILLVIIGTAWVTPAV